MKYFYRNQNEAPEVKFNPQNGRAQHLQENTKLILKLYWNSEHTPLKV